MQPHTRHFLLSCALVILSACSTPTPPVALHDFGSVKPSEFTSASRTYASRITVNAPTWLWDNRIRYRFLFQNSTQVRFYGLDRWLAPPPELFEQFLNSRFEDQPLSLNLQVLEFEQQFESKHNAQVILSFTASVYETGQKKLIGTKTFRLKLATPTANAKGAIEGFTRLIVQAANQLDEWLSSLGPLK